MQSRLADFIAATPAGATATEILGRCVHCGFCNATCPTYQLLGDELDGPRGRIYQIKELLEGGEAADSTRRHLDRCLTCRSCETTCPSGVEYGRLLDIGRAVVEERIPRGRRERLLRWGLRQVLPYRRRFGALVRLGRWMRWLLPERLRRHVPKRAPVAAGAWPASTGERRVLVLEGCVQGALSPATDAAAARVLERLGIGLVSVPGTGCCGALSLHLGATRDAQEFARRNIAAWSAELEAGAEAVLASASGCGVHLHEYGQLLREDPDFAERAASLAARVRDLAELIEPAALAAALEGKSPAPRRVAFHAPCTLQHGLRIRGRVEELLRVAGCELLPVADAHLCCGSAGSYSLLQPELAEQLGANKIRALEQGRPDEILSANIGCQMHLQARTERPVRHWIELIDEVLAG